MGEGRAERPPLSPRPPRGEGRGSMISSAVARSRPARASSSWEGAAADIYAGRRRRPGRRGSLDPRRPGLLRLCSAALHVLHRGGYVYEQGLGRRLLLEGPVDAVTWRSGRISARSLSPGGSNWGEHAGHDGSGRRGHGRGMPSHLGQELAPGGAHGVPADLLDQGDGLGQVATAPAPHEVAGDEHRRHAGRRARPGA